MKKVLLATDKPFAKSAVEGIKNIVVAAGHEFAIIEKYKTQQEFMDAAADANAIIIRSDIADKALIEVAKKLEIIVRAGAGFDNIDLAAATEHKVVAMNTPGQNSNAVAELALGMMVYMARNTFNGNSGFELRGKTLGIHAYGNVGKYVAEIAKGFGMKVYGFDPFVTKEAMLKDGVTPVETAQELYKTCQYVSLHIPANAQTKQSINYELLMSMPAGAVLVNTARKEVIHEEDLKKVFAERADFKYLSDVEPDCKAELTEKYAARYYATPKKMGAQTEEANVNSGLAAANQIVKFFATGDITFKVNK